jgi:hypothetical protein
MDAMNNYSELAFEFPFERTALNKEAFEFNQKSC